MGNSESKYRPYICLLKQLLKKGQHRASEKRLEELLKVIEVHCSWFPTLGTLDLDKWEAVGQDLRDLHANGTSFSSSIWETFELVRSVLEPLQTDSEEEREDREGKRDSPKRTKKEREDEGSESNSTIVPRNLYPDLEECFQEEFPPPFWPPPPPCANQMWQQPKTCCNANNPFIQNNPFAQKPPAITAKQFSFKLSALEQGTHQAKMAGDVDALNFPVIFRQIEAPGQNNPDGIHEAVYEPFPFKLLRELKQAVLQFGTTSPYTVGLVRGIADGHRMIPTDWQALAQTCLTPAQFLQFKNLVD